MATAIASSFATAPKPDNLYLVEFANTTGSRKVSFKSGPLFDLLHSQVIKRYVPSNNSAMANSFEIDTKTIHYGYPFHVDPLTGVLASVPIKDLLNFSYACRSFYLTVRSNALWETKLKQLLPSVKPCSNSPFSAQQQFQIVFDRILKMKKPYLSQLKQYENTANEISKTIVDLESGKHGPLTKTELEGQLSELLGKDHTHPASDSKIGRCTYACDSIFKQLDDQKTFEEVIEGSEKIYQWENLNRLKI